MVAKRGRGAPAKYKDAKGKAVKRQALGIWLMPDLLERLDRHVALTGQKRLAVIATAIERYLNSEAAKILEDAAEKARKAAEKASV